MKKATNGTKMRLKNEKLILSLIHNSPISRVDIAKKTGLTKAAVTIIVDDLKKRGIVEEQAWQNELVGRNPVMLSLNKDCYCFIGVNITRLNAAVGICDILGNRLSEKTFPVDTPQKTVKKICRSINEQLASLDIQKSRLFGVSCVTPGPVDTQNGIILNPPNFKMWHMFPIVSALKKELETDVVFMNVSSATALAEKYFGAARDCENFLALQVDEGIGSGIMLGDRLFTCPSELGHVSIKYDGEKCECGNRGCLEKYASIPRILAGTPFKSWKDAVDGESDVVIQEAEYLQGAITSANNIFAFDKVVLCGDLSYKPQRITELVSEKLKISTLSSKEVSVCAGAVESPVLIAASAAIHSFLT